MPAKPSHQKTKRAPQAPLQPKPLQPISLIFPPSSPGTPPRTLQPHQNAIDPLPGGVLFFACPKKRTKRKGSPAAETTPVDGLRNRRGKNSLRSNSLPLFPGSAPRRPAQRQRAVFFPRNTPCPAPPSLAGPAFLFATGDSEGDRSHAPAWERRPGRSSVRLCCRQPTTAPTTIAGMARSYRNIRHLR